MASRDCAEKTTWTDLLSPPGDTFDGEYRRLDGNNLHSSEGDVGESGLGDEVVVTLKTTTKHDSVRENWKKKYKLN